MITVEASVEILGTTYNVEIEGVHPEEVAQEIVLCTAQLKRDTLGQLVGNISPQINVRDLKAEAETRESGSSADVIYLAIVRDGLYFDTQGQIQYDPTCRYGIE